MSTNRRGFLKALGITPMGVSLLSKSTPRPTEAPVISPTPGVGKPERSQRTVVIEAIRNYEEGVSTCGLWVTHEPTGVKTFAVTSLGVAPNIGDIMDVRLPGYQFYGEVKSTRQHQSAMQPIESEVRGIVI